MSEKGSFVTEYVYCKDCFSKVMDFLKSKETEKYFVPFDLSPFPIVAGKIGGLYSGEEIHTFEFQMVEEIEKIICHPLRIAVLAEWGENVFKIEPKLKGKS